MYQMYIHGQYTICNLHSSCSDISQAPGYKTVCGGNKLSAVGICIATVSFLLGYLVICPTVLTFAVSATKMRPCLPPLTVAVCVELGKEITALPAVKATHLDGTGALAILLPHIQRGWMSLTGRQAHCAIPRQILRG